MCIKHLGSSVSQRLLHGNICLGSLLAEREREREISSENSLLKKNPNLNFQINVKKKNPNLSNYFLPAFF